MMKVADLVLITEIAKCFSERKKVIIVHPNNIVRQQYFVQFGGKALINTHIASEISM